MRLSDIVSAFKKSNRYQSRREQTQKAAREKAKRTGFMFRGKTVMAATKSEARAVFKEMFRLDRIPAGESPCMMAAAMDH